MKQEREKSLLYTPFQEIFAAQMKIFRRKTKEFYFCNYCSFAK